LLQNTPTSGNDLGFPAVPATFRETFGKKQPTVKKPCRDVAQIQQARRDSAEFGKLSQIIV